MNTTSSMDNNWSNSWDSVIINRVSLIYFSSRPPLSLCFHLRPLLYASVYALARRMRLYWLAFKLAFAARKCDKYKISKNYNELYPPPPPQQK